MQPQGQDILTCSLATYNLIYVQILFIIKALHNPCALYMQTPS